MPKKPTLILGFNGSHDGSAALLEDGKILGTSTKERINRLKKSGNGNSFETIEPLLARFDKTLDDIDCVAFCDNYQKPEDSFVRCYDLDGKIRSKSNIYGELKPYCHKTDNFEKLNALVGSKTVPAYFINHHLGHIAYSYFTSPFERATCFSMDGSPAENSLLTFAYKNQFFDKKFNELNVSLIYDWFTHCTLGNPLFKAGSMMGLSAYGSRPKDLSFIEALDLNDIASLWQKLTGKESKMLEQSRTDVTEKDFEIAAQLQFLFEELTVTYLNQIPPEVVEKFDFNLCLSGGSFLNCKLNSKIVERTRFKDVHIVPACGDDGLALGSALFVNHVIFDHNREMPSKTDLMYSGGSYKTSENIGSPFDSKLVADLLSKGKVIGLFQGRSEFGPRALGNRSILADPRRPEMRNYINREIKGREWFRPFGATVLQEKAAQWFEMVSPESPYMLFTVSVIQPDLIPAVSHVDETCRIQTLAQQDNIKFYNLIADFEALTGVPLLLNTSLNDASEPIVETPEDALALFERSKLDGMILENRMLIKGMAD